ncbi:hypothetical protein FLACHUCJ7_01981 [Flavobacterium chungangense]|uniref:Uncharacterized protein n=1 Tax=Flavobacterium chungangense TaxID=554283 RepID=A0A6V6YYX9_9FLAO|nr:hypothetical protein FLACHUCJ7_01981 [Flavobacterium chungangense]
MKINLIVVFQRIILKSELVSKFLCERPQRAVLPAALYLILQLLQSEIKN